MVAIGYQLSIINLVTSFLRDFSIGGRCTGDSDVAKVGDLNHRLVVIRQFLSGLERRLQKIVARDRYESV